MPIGTQTQNVSGWAAQFAALGNFGLREVTPKLTPYLFAGVTGGFNSAVGITGGGPAAPTVGDITSAPGTTIIQAQHHCGSNQACVLRPYIDGLVMTVQGNTAWSGDAGVQIQDTLGNMGIFVPTSALVGNARIVLPEPENRYSIYLTAAANPYNASTGAVTFAATSFVTTSYVNNAPFRIVAGTGAGQAGIIKSNTATVITPQNGSATFAVPPDATSVFEFPYWVVTGESGTTAVVGSQGGAATPLTASALANGYYAVITSGTAVGANRSITSNTNNTVTVPTWSTNPANGDLIEFTTANQLNGVVDFATGGMPCFGVYTGLQVFVPASMAAGSPLHIEWWGHFAP